MSWTSPTLRQQQEEWFLGDPAGQAPCEHYNAVAAAEQMFSNVDDVRCYNSACEESSKYLAYLTKGSKSRQRPLNKKICKKPESESDHKKLSYVELPYRASQLIDRHDKHCVRTRESTPNSNTDTDRVSSLLHQPKS
jgi:hypothetical protein